MNPERSWALAVRVWFHNGRYHGVPEWPPSPARLFQALIAGSGPVLPEEVMRALQWLETLDPPAVAAPRVSKGQEVKLFVPNNDLDSVWGDPARIAEIRTTKWVRPLLFDERTPVVYVWSVPQADENEQRGLLICNAAERLYQLGRGVDMAFARAELTEPEVGEAALTAHPSVVYRPTPGGLDGIMLACPVSGSLASLSARHAAGEQRFRASWKGRKAIQVFTQAPKPSFAPVIYNCPPERALFDLRPAGEMGALSAWRLIKATQVVEQVRDNAVQRLLDALPDRASEITDVLVGRGPDSPGAPPEQRVRIIPLPSIGNEYVDRGIRRVLVEVPTGGPLRAADVFWAFSGLEVRVGEDAPPAELTRATDERMLDHYGLTAPRRAWRTVTPVVLPESARRRRIDPSRRVDDAKDGRERAEEEARAAFAVTQALRHARIGAPFESIHVQREPFEGRGERSEAFAPGTRFPKERMWHVEISFLEPTSGPLVLGDGRFLGLGLMAPARRNEGVFAFAIEAGLVGSPDPSIVAEAMRRAVMARAQDVLGPGRPLPAYFSGHRRDGSPSTEGEPHLAFLYDPTSQRLLVVAPHRRDQREPSRGERKHLAVLDQALAGFRELRAGAAGCLALRPVAVHLRSDPLFAASRRWKSVTPYVVNRHSRGLSAAEALTRDVHAACRQAGGYMHPAEVVVQDVRGVPRVGLIGRVVLTFSTAVPGPLLLGRTRYRGGGLFIGDANGTSSG